MEIMSVLNSVDMTPDKKIEEYLERAKNFARKHELLEWSNLIEIAKMIQLEEHREQK